MSDGDETLSTTTSNIEALVRKSLRVHEVVGGEGILAVPDGLRLVPRDVVLSPELAKRPRVNHRINTTDIGAFCTIMEDYGGVNSAVFSAPDGLHHTGVLNYRAPAQSPKIPSEGLGRRDWVVRLSILQSIQYESLLLAIESDSTGLLALQHLLLELREYLDSAESSNSPALQNGKAENDSADLDEDMALIQAVTGSKFITCEDLAQYFTDGRTLPTSFLVSVAIPIYNQLSNPPLILSFKAAKEKNGWDITVVNSAKADASARRFATKKVRSKLSTDIPHFSASTIEPD